ncbi:FAD dependent oxidoreductase [Pycnococcus provasolii]
MAPLFSENSVRGCGAARPGWHRCCARAGGARSLSRSFSVPSRRQSPRTQEKKTSLSRVSRVSCASVEGDARGGGGGGGGGGGNPNANKQAKRYAVIGCGLVGAATAYHVVRAHAKKYGCDVPVFVDVHDELGMAGGATAACSGMLHPMAPSGKPLWEGERGCRETLALLRVAGATRDGVARRTGALRVAKHKDQETAFAATCGGEQQQQQHRKGRWSPRLLTQADAQRALPGVAMTTNAALFVPGAMVVNAVEYVSRLMDVANRRAEATGGAVRIVKERVRSATEVAQACDGVIIAAGAAVGSLCDVDAVLYDAWKSGDGCDDGTSIARVPVELCHGEAVHLAPTPSSLSSSASLLGSHYVAMGSRYIAVGATRRKLEGVATLQPDELRPAADIDAASSMLDAASTRLPSLVASDCDAFSMVSGVRASSPRTEHGCAPIVGRAPRHSGVWLAVAVGARGLVYHAYIARLVADALVSGEGDGAFPRALTRFVK